MIISIYTAIFVSRLFKVAIALAVYFDLKVKQFNVVNAFVNTTQDTCS